MLTLVRIEAGKLELTLCEEDFPNFCATIVDMMRQAAHQKGIRFIYEFKNGQKAHEIRLLDEKRLRQVLLNLLSNAIKFTKQGHVIFRVTSKGENVRFSVIDTGIGIPPSQLETIFQPFEQVETLRSDGTRLGLAISKRLVELMGGQIEVESEIGKGSTFTFELTLPVVGSSAKGSSPVQVEIVGYQGARKRILVVDDKPQMR